MAGLFNPFQRSSPQTILTKGSLVAFNYPQSQAIEPYSLNDHFPLVIVFDANNLYIRGINLHYLTFLYIKKLLTSRNFDYTAIKPDKYLTSAFRTYYLRGMVQVKFMDADFLVRILGAMKSFQPMELETVKQQIRNQIRTHLQPKAGE